MPSHQPTGAPTPVLTNPPTPVVTNPPTPASTNLPTNGPSQTPTTSPTAPIATSFPSASPTATNTRSPTSADTVPQTLPPTPLPAPGPTPVQPVAVNVVFETEIFPRGQQRERRATRKGRHLQTLPPNTNADTCLQACVRSVTTLRFFNLYYDDATGDLVCSCVETFTGSRTVETGRVYAACITTGEDLAIAAKTKPAQVVKAGKDVTYAVRITNVQDPKTGQPASGLTLAVLLPPRVQARVSKLTVLPIPVRSDPKNPKSKVRPTIDAENVVRWSMFTLNPRRGRTFLVKIRVRPGVVAGTRLEFAAAIYQTAPTDSMPRCAKWAPTNSTVSEVN